MYVSAIAAGSLVLSVASALAASGVAEISAVQGKVLVNQGDGFETVTGSVMLKAGDKVMVGEDSSAEISYPLSDCLVTASASSLVTISETAPCKAGEIVGAVDSIFVHAAQDADPNEEEHRRRTALLLLAGVAGTALILCVVEFCEGNGNGNGDGNAVSKP